MHACGWYGWLKLKALRRSSLIAIEAEIRRGQLHGDDQADRRQALLQRLMELVDDPTLSARELVRVARIFALMGCDVLGIRPDAVFRFRSQSCSPPTPTD